MTSRIEALFAGFDKRPVRERTDQAGDRYAITGDTTGAMYVRRTTADGARVTQAWFDRGVLLAARDSSGTPEAPDGGLFFFDGGTLVAADALHGDPMALENASVVAMAREVTTLADAMRTVAATTDATDPPAAAPQADTIVPAPTGTTAGTAVPSATSDGRPSEMATGVGGYAVVIGLAGLIGQRLFKQARRRMARPQPPTRRPAPVAMALHPAPSPAAPSPMPPHAPAAAPMARKHMPDPGASPLTVSPEELAEAIRRTRVVPFLEVSPWPVPELTEPVPVAWQVPGVVCETLEGAPPGALTVLPGLLLFSTPFGPMVIDLDDTVVVEGDAKEVSRIVFTTTDEAGTLFMGSLAPRAGSQRAFAPVVAICELFASNDDTDSTAQRAMGRNFRSPDAVDAWVREVLAPPPADNDPATGLPTWWQATATATNTTTTPRGDAFLERVQRAVGREYRILEQVGQGGFGALFRAHQVNLDRQVAIKVLLPANADDPGIVTAFRKEARLIAGLEHPHIVPINQFGAGDGIWWLSMRWVDAKSLDEVMAEYRSLDACLGLMRQVASALDFAHARRVVHRDIKLPNLLISRSGHAYVADFGIAADLDASMDGAAGWGSRPFMPPEQFTGDGVGPATDQYALGQVVHSLLTGRLAVTAPDGDWLRAAESGSRAIDRALPEPVRLAIARALAPDPAERFATVSAFIEAMEAARDTPAVGPVRGRLRGTVVDARAAGAVAGSPDLPRAPRQSNRRRSGRSSPLAARHAALPAIEPWWLEHLRDLSDPTVEKGETLSPDRPTMRHQRLWAEATAWLDAVRGVVLGDLSTPWTVQPNQWQIGRLSYTYWGRLVPQDDTGLDDAFHVGVQLSKRLKWVPKLEPSLQHLADVPVIAVWGSTNDRLIESRGLDVARWRYGRRMHQALVERPELWRAGGALVRYTDADGTTTLVRPETYFEAIGGPESEIGNCDLFSPILTLDEVLRDPADAGRRVAGFIRLLAEIVAEARTGLTER